MEPRPPPLLLLLLLAALGAALAEHRPDYDREALLGGQDEAEEFSKLSPEEQQKRLKGIISKIDMDLDGFLTEAELSSWIQHSFKDYVVEDAKQQFHHYDKDRDGHVSWEEYNIQMYDRLIDFEEDATLEDAEEESFRQLHLKDKKRFEKANKDGDSELDFDEFIAFEHPEEADYMKDFVIQEALEEHDKDGDGFVSMEEFLGDYRRDPSEWPGVPVRCGAFKNHEWLGSLKVLLRGPRWRTLKGQGRAGPSRKPKHFKTLLCIDLTLLINKVSQLLEKSIQTLSLLS